MRVALLATTVVSLVIGISTFACSSAQPAATDQGDSGIALPKNDNSAPTDPVSTEPPPPQDPVDAGDTLDAGGGLGTTEGDAGSRCLPGSIRESETNNEIAAADQLQPQSSTFCGRITAGDVDFWTFTMPDQVGNFQFQIDNVTNQNQFKIEPSADGEAFSFFGDYPFKPGKPYVFKISSKGAALEYRIKMIFSQ